MRPQLLPSAADEDTPDQGVEYHKLLSAIDSPVEVEITQIGRRYYESFKLVRCVPASARVLFASCCALSRACAAPAVRRCLVSFLQRLLRACLRSASGM